MPFGEKAIRLVGIGLAKDVLDSLVDYSWVVSSFPWFPVTRSSHRKLTRVDGVGILVGNLNAELLLNGHDDLDGVERVEAEVVGKVSSGLDLYRKFGLDRNGTAGMSGSPSIVCIGAENTYVGSIVDLD